MCLLIVLAFVQHAPGLVLGHHRGAFDGTAVQAGLEGATNQTVLLPAMQQAGQALRAGDLPLWNDHARFGEPFHVSGAELWYPPYWLLMLDDPAGWLELLLFLHTALACALAYRFLRGLPLSRYVAFVGAGAYGLGWFLWLGLDRLPEAAAAAWLPLVLELASRAVVSTRRARLIPLLGVVTAVMFLTGGTATAGAGAALALVYALVCLHLVEPGTRTNALSGVALAACIAAGAASPLWLDALQFGSSVESPAAHAPRAGVAALAGALAPGLFGGASGQAPPALANANPGSDPLELLFYPGALVLFVALLGLFRPKRTVLELFWLLVFGAGLLLCLDGPLASFLLGLGVAAPHSGAWLVVPHLALVVIATLAFESFLDAPRARRFALPVAAGLSWSWLVAVLVVGLLLAGPARAVLALLTGSGNADELDAARGAAFAAFAPPALAVAALALLFCCWRRLGVLRFKAIVAFVALGELCFLSLSGAPRATVHGEQAARLGEALPGGAGRMLAVGTPAFPPRALAATGRRVVDTTGDGVLARTARFLRAIDADAIRHSDRVAVVPLQRTKKLEHGLLALAAVDVVHSVDPIESAAFAAPPARPDGESAPPPFHVATAIGARPRAKLVFLTVDAGEPDRAIREHATSLAQRTVVEEPPADFTCKHPARTPELTWRVDRAGHLQLEVDLADGRGYLRIADAFAAGWTATVDGHPTPILAADVAFRAVPLREGRHVVELRFSAWSWTYGRWLLLASAIAALLLVAREGLAARSKRRGTSRRGEKLLRRA